MTAFERAVSVVTERFEGVDASYRRDVALTTNELTAGSGFRARSLELLGLVGLALRLRSRARTGNRTEEIWRQGTYIGSVVLLVALAGTAWAGIGSFPTIAGAAALAAAIACAMRGHRSAAALLAAGGAAAHIAGAPAEAEAGAFATSCIVAVAGLLAGTPPPAAARGAALATAALSLAGLALALGAGAGAVAITATFTAIGAIVLLALGWFDPRLAAAATTLVFSRLLASGFDQLGQALAVLAEDGGQALLLRWLVMAVGVVGAWFATNRSIRRLGGL